MKKYYISPITDRMILPMGNVLTGSGGDGEGVFTPPPGMPSPGFGGPSAPVRNTLIVK